MNNLIKLFLFAILCIDCTGKANSVIAEDESCDTIFVTYVPHLYETSVRTSCSSIAELGKCDRIELTIKEISTEDFNLIADFIHQMNPAGQDSSCEARVHVKMGNNELCLGDFICCACDIEDRDLNTSNFEYAIYKIKHLSGYYNCYDTLDIKYDNLTQKFGIPEDYCHDSKPYLIELYTDENGEVHEFGMDEGIRRVALIRKENLLDWLGRF